MDDLTRLWLSTDVRAASALGAPPTLAQYAIVRDGARLCAERVESSCAAAANGGERRHAFEGRALDHEALLAELDRLASLHAGEQVQIELPRGAIELLVRHALALAHLPSLAEPRNLVLDWPTRSDPQLRCAFVGLDVDWRPPPPARRAARFPGGPGSAPSPRG